jgi:hypothetical protein
MLHADLSDRQRTPPCLAKKRACPTFRLSETQCYSLLTFKTSYRIYLVTSRTTATNNEDEAAKAKGAANELVKYKKAQEAAKIEKLRQTTEQAAREVVKLAKKEAGGFKRPGGNRRASGASYIPPFWKAQLNRPAPKFKRNQWASRPSIISPSLIAQ